MTYIIYLKKAIKKDKKGTYNVMCADMGYRSFFITYDIGTMAEIMDTSPQAIHNIFEKLNENESMQIGEFKIIENKSQVEKETK